MYSGEQFKEVRNTTSGSTLPEALVINDGEPPVLGVPLHNTAWRASAAPRALGSLAHLEQAGNAGSPAMQQLFGFYKL